MGKGRAWALLPCSIAAFLASWAPGTLLRTELCMNHLILLYLMSLLPQCPNAFCVRQWQKDSTTPLFWVMETLTPVFWLLEVVCGPQARVLGD